MNTAQADWNDRHRRRAIEAALSSTEQETREKVVREVVSALEERAEQHDALATDDKGHPDVKKEHRMIAVRSRQDAKFIRERFAIERDFLTKSEA